jgi:hypothetical protein
MLIFTYEIVKMRFLQPGNREPHMRFPPPRNPDNHSNRTGKQEKRLVKMPQGLKNINLIFQK